MPSDLEHHEKEDEEAERLIGKKPPPSRKYTERRGPKHDNRRRRMEADPDPDTETADEDLSMNYKNIGGSSLPDIALRVFLSAEPDPKIFEKMRKFINTQAKKYAKQSKTLGEAYFNFAKENYLAPYKQTGDRDIAIKFGQFHENTKLEGDEFYNEVTEVKERISGARDRKALISSIQEEWPDEREWAKKVTLIIAIKGWISDIEQSDKVDKWLVTYLTGEKKERELITEIIDDSKTGLAASRIKKENALKLAVLTSVLKAIEKDPDSKLEDLDQEAEAAYDSIQKLGEVQVLMNTWEKAMHSMKETEPGKEWEWEEGIDSAVKSVESAFGLGKHGEDIPKDPDEDAVDLDTLVAGFRDSMEEKYGEVPEALDAYFEGFSRAASNKTYASRFMSDRTATFHGYVKQGHPSGVTQTPWKSTDKRYFGKKHYDSILKYSKSLLNEDWFKNGWEGGAEDAPIRAALDISIFLADENKYQAKIDVETYNMLLNKLAKEDFDLFSETMHSGEKRKAMSNKKDVQTILRIASDMRKTDPANALRLVKSMRSLVADGQAPGLFGPQDQTGNDPSHKLPLEQTSNQGDQDQDPGPGLGLQEQTGIDMPGSGDGKDLNPEELKKGQAELQKALDSEDLDAFVNAFKEMEKTVQTASRLAALYPTLVRSRLAADIEFQSLAQLSPDEQKELLEGAKAKSMEMGAAVEELDIEMFLRGWKDLEDLVRQKTASAASIVLEKSFSALTASLSEIGKRSSWDTMGHLHSAEEALGRIASSTIPLGDVVRLAFENPELRPVLLPIITAAKKKKDKKKSKKKDKKKKGKGGNPFADKDGDDDGDDDGGKKDKGKGKGKGKVPPAFLKQQKKKKKKASISITSADGNW